MVVVRLAKTGGDTSDETGDTDKDSWQDWWLDLPFLTLPLCTVGWSVRTQKHIFSERVKGTIFVLFKSYLRGGG